MFKLLFVILAVLIAAYIIGGRRWLKAQPWAKGFFAFIEPIELKLWEKSETILFARLMVLAGLLPPFLDQLALLNMPEIANLLPDAYRGWWTLTFAVIGIITELNRRYTTKPLEVVAIPDAAPAAVLKQVAQVEAQNAAAVAAVETAKAEGTV